MTTFAEIYDRFTFTKLLTFMVIGVLLLNGGRRKMVFVPNTGSVWRDPHTDVTMTVLDTPGFGAKDTDTVKVEWDSGDVGTKYVDHWRGMEKVSSAPDKTTDDCNCDDDSSIVDMDDYSDWCDCPMDGTPHVHCMRCGGVAFGGD